jgi:hypothetical protein
MVRINLPGKKEQQVQGLRSRNELRVLKEQPEGQCGSDSGSEIGSRVCSYRAS